MYKRQTYDGTTLKMTITDAVVNATYTASWQINIPSTVGNDFAYVGFTGGTGGLSASQKIESWTWASTAPPIPQQWTIVTTSESAPNAVPLTDVNGNLYACSGQNPDNSSDSNSNCYNPLVVTTDWTATPTPTGATIATVLANSFTNSSCSNGNLTSLTVNGYSPLGSYAATITLVFQNGATIIFRGASSSNANQFSGTFTSSGTCMASDSGAFTATLFQAAAGTFAGSFESSSGAPAANVQLALQTNTNFSVAGTVAPVPGASVCFSSLTIATPLANSYGESMASGDVVLAYASDGTGNVVAFVMSNTDANGAPLPNGGLYVTYMRCV